MDRVFWLVPRGNGIDISRIDNMTPKNGLRVRLHPGRKSIPYGRDVSFITRQDFFVKGKAGVISWERYQTVLDEQNGGREFSGAVEHPKVPKILRFLSPCVFP